jgi:hypothetical protein
MIKIDKKLQTRRKAISSVVAAVIITTISITLVGTGYLFSKNIMEGAIAETFEIIDISQNRIIVRNTGTQPISRFMTLIDGIEVENSIKDPPIQTTDIGTLFINITGITTGRHQLVLITRSMSQTWMLEIEQETTSSTTTTSTTSSTTTTSTSTSTTTTITSTSTTTIPCNINGTSSDGLCYAECNASSNCAGAIPGEANTCCSGCYYTDIVGPNGTDGKVDARDVSFVSSHYGANCSSSNYDSIADLNNDCKIDAKDVSAVSGKFGTTCKTNMPMSFSYVKTEQGTAEIGKPVKWISKISVNNPSSDEVKNYSLSQVVPQDASNIQIKDKEERTLAVGQSISVDVKKNESVTYFVEYETPAPYKIETIRLTGKWMKMIRVKSDAFEHYNNVIVSSEVSEDINNPRVYYIENETKIDVTDNITYNVSFADTDGDGKVDAVSWVVPELSEKNFMIEGGSFVQPMALKCCCFTNCDGVDCGWYMTNCPPEAFQCADEICSLITTTTIPTTTTTIPTNYCTFYTWSPGSGFYCQGCSVSISNTVWLSSSSSNGNLCCLSPCSSGGQCYKSYPSCALSTTYKYCYTGSCAYNSWPSATSGQDCQQVDNRCNITLTGKWDSSEARCEGCNGQTEVNSSSSCGSISYSTKCESVCGAPSVCDEQPVGYVFTQCNLTGQTYFADKCGSGTSCNFTDDTTTCRSSAYNSSCTAASDCNNQPPNSNHCHGGENGDLYTCNSTCADVFNQDCGNTSCVGSCPGCTWNIKGCSSGLKICSNTPYDVDTHPLFCSGCLGNGRWNIGGDVSGCCGDDANEYNKTCAKSGVTEDICSGDNDACCNATNKCVYHNSCYANGEFNSDYPCIYCNGGTWMYKSAGSTGDFCGACKNCSGSSGVCVLVTANNGYNCNADCTKCSSGNCLTRPSGENTEVNTTCFNCDGTNNNSQPYSGETGINCTNDCWDCIAGNCTAMTEVNDGSCNTQCTNCSFGSCIARNDDVECSTCYYCPNEATGSCSAVASGQEGKNCLLACKNCDGSGNCVNITDGSTDTVGSNLCYDITHCSSIATGSQQICKCLSSSCSDTCNSATCQSWENFTNCAYDCPATINYPLNTTYNPSVLQINSTLSGDAGWCGFNLDNTANKTMSNSSRTSWYSTIYDVEGTHRVYVYCNNTLGYFGLNNSLYYTSTYTTPFENLYVNKNLNFCPPEICSPGIYYLNDTDDNGVIIFNANDVRVNCNRVTLIGNNDLNSKGINITNKDNVALKNCTVKQYDYDYYLQSSQKNELGDVNFTEVRNFYLDSSSLFNYHNTNKEIWLNTSVNESDKIKRRILDLNQSSVLWEDNGSKTANYDISGLKTDTNYAVYDNSNYKFTKYADINGKLQTFSIGLGSLHPLDVEEIGKLIVNLSMPSPLICNETYPCDWDQYSLYQINATVKCVNANCGNVQGLVRYNSSGNSMSPINTTEGAAPFYIVGGGKPVMNWSQVDTSGTSPGNITGLSMVYDSDADRIIMFGGFKTNYGRMNETWVFNRSDSKWYNVTKPPPNMPPFREHSPAMAYDSVNKRTILFGGYNGTTNRMDDTWEFNSSDNKWYKRNPALKPTGRGYSSMVYVSSRKVMVLFGGTSTGTNRLADTWAYNYSTNTWTNITNKTNPKCVPTAREEHYMAYDSNNDRIIMYGGFSVSSVNFNDTWAFNYTDLCWYNITNTAYLPIARRNHKMVYDSESQRVILFGGMTTSTDFRDDTWELNYTDKKWYLMNMINRPPAREFEGMAYDSKTDETIMYGGDYNLNLPRYNDTWILDYSSGGGAGGNPISLGTLNDGMSTSVNFIVNTTGDINTRWKIDVNFSSDLNVWNNTNPGIVRIKSGPPEIWNLTIRNTTDYPITETSPAKEILITVNVSDNNLDYVEGNFTWPNGIIVYKNLTYITGKPYTYNWTYWLPVTVPPGTANIKVTAYDTTGLKNSTNTTLQILILIVLDLNNTPVNFSKVIPGQTVNATPNGGWPLYAVITGNVQMNLTQYAESYLTGLNYPSEKIIIKNITWNTTNVSSLFSQLTDTEVIVNNSIQSGLWQQPIYYKFNVPPVRSQQYGGMIYIKLK